MASAEYQREWHKKNPGKRRIYNKRWRDGNSDKSRAATKKWRIANPAHLRQYESKYAQLNPERKSAKRRRYYEQHKVAHAIQTKTWQAAKPEKVRLSRARWEQKNPGRKNARTRLRQTRQLQRTPVWANHEWIRHAYEVAADMTAKMGEPYHVDHEIPLQGRRVSGLHVYENLQILPARENCQKHNAFDIR